MYARHNAKDSLPLRLLVIVSFTSMLTLSGRGHMISSNFECAWYGVDIAGPKSLRGELSLEKKIYRVASRLPLVKGEDGSTIYPAGTVIDRGEVIDNWLHLWVSFPEGTRPGSLDPAQVYQGSEVLRHYFADSEQLVGIRVHARANGQQEYQDLEAWVMHETPTVPQPALETLDYEINGPGPQPDPDYEAWYSKLRQQEPAKNVAGQSSFGGSGMPNGALAGRIIFTYGGHGRTWDGDASPQRWRWQRGYYNNMLEDFGNVDGSDAYAYYCFNAGATVVSFRPIGYQNNEVIVDNTSTGFSAMGSWSNSTNSRFYGTGAPNYRFANTADTETALATYTPNIPEAGYYPVYTWANYGSDRVPGQLYRIRSTGGESQVRIDHRRVGCGWVYLGTYYFNAGSNSATGSVAISNLNPPSVPAGSYIAVADAIRFGNGMGDVNNGGGASGWSRREESTVYWIQNGWGNGNTAGTWASTQVWNNANTSDDEPLSWNAPPRMAAQMYRVHSDTSVSDKRYALYLGWHSNGANGAARGSLGLITGTPTTNQAWWAAKTSDELDAASAQEAGNWEHTWYNRSSSTYSGGYSEITNTNFESKMDATIIEVAYHDNAQDAALLRDPRVRNVHGKACYRAAVQYFNVFRQGPLAYLPEPPDRFRAANTGSGGVVLNWQPGPTGGSKGQAPTSYRVYQSADGLGWGDSVSVAGTGHTITGLTPGEIYYFRVTGVNSGGESFPSDTLAVRIAEDAAARILVVNGYDRIDRFNNIPRGGHPQTVEQLIHQQNNTYDYTLQHGEAIAASGRNFDSAMNEAVISGDINLNDYEVVVWILGEESSRDNTFNATERTKIDAFLAAGKSLFLSGAETAYEQDFLNTGRTFYRSSLKAQYVADTAGSYMANGSAGSIFARLSNIDFSPSSTMYNVDSPDVITPVNGSTEALAYAPASPVSDAFDSIGSWQTPGYSGTTTADSSTFQIVASPRRQGTGAGDLHYNWDLGTVLREYNSGGATFPNTATFAVWVYGDNSGNTLSLFLRDTVDNELFQNTPIEIDFSGWRQITWDLPSDPATRFAGAGDDAMSGAMRLDSLYLLKGASSPASGHLYFDEATYTTGTSGSPGAAAVQYDGSYKLVHIAFPFEAIGSPAQRGQLMERAMAFLDPSGDPPPPQPPAAPSDLMTETSGSSIVINWTDNATNEEGFSLERIGGEELNFTVIATLPSDTTMYNDEQGLQPGSRYCYRIRAYNADGNSDYSNNACSTTPITPPDDYIGEAENPGGPGDTFGYSIAKITAGKKVGFVVGAPGADSNGKREVGRAYVFFPPSNQPALVLENPAPIPSSESSYFGHSVAAVGNSIIVGAPGRESHYAEQSGGHVYLFSAVTGELERTFVAPEPVSGDRFGESVAGFGKTAVVVGAPDSYGQVGHVLNPRVYVFDLKKGTVQTILDQSGVQGSFFGHSVAGGKGKLAATRETGSCLGGALDVFTKKGAVFTSTPDAFSVADASGKFLVGAPLYPNCLHSVDTPYSYLLAGRKLKMVWPSPNGLANDRFGHGLAGGRKFIGIGAPLYDEAAASDTGRAYLFRVKSTAPAVTYQNPVPEQGDWFGHSMALAERIKLPTKQKVSIMAVGAPYADNGGTDAGAVYFYEVPLK